jgi:ABC-type siderophore export system fused ATPase/permease subunit
MKRTPSSLADELNNRAVAALDGARKMSLGDERTKAMHKARILRNAAEMHAHRLWSLITSDAYELIAAALAVQTHHSGRHHVGREPRPIAIAAAL